jgi:hypothetical protein
LLLLTQSIPPERPEDSTLKIKEFRQMSPNMPMNLWTFRATIIRLVKTNRCTDTNTHQCNEPLQGTHHQQKYRLNKNNGCTDTNIDQCNEPLQGTRHQ